MEYPLTFSTWDNKENLAIKSVVKTGYFSMGKKVEEFERKFAKYLNRKYAIMVNSGSSANLIGMSAFFYKELGKLQRGDEVIVPAIAWSTTYSPLKQLGLKLKIIDVNFENLNLNFDLLKKAITKKTKMIVSVSILGVPAELEKIRKLCKKQKIIFFEDNCESLGSKIGKIKTGKFGDISTHSFFYSHHISTMEGGMCVTDNFELYCILKSLRAHGWSRDLPKINTLTKPLYGSKQAEYNFVLPGFNVRPGEINAAIGIEQLKKLDDLVKHRIKNWNLFKKLFKNDKRFTIQNTNYKNASFAFTFVINNNKKNLKQKIYKILKKKGIAYRLITGGCFTKHPYKKYFNYKIFKTLKVANKIHDDGFFVGNAGQDLTKEINYLYHTLRSIK